MKDFKTKSTPCGKVIQNLVIRGSVIGNAVATAVIAKWDAGEAVAEPAAQK